MSAKINIPILVPNHPFLRTDSDGSVYQVTFSAESIKRIFEDLKNESAHLNIELFINVESDNRFLASAPVGSLMAEANTEDRGKTFSIEVNR